MCGIVGFLGRANAVHIVIPALQRLEYRGYDSAGIAVISGGKLHIAKKKGKISNLIAHLSAIGFPPSADIGLGHTRWATHGVPSDENAHPHVECTGKVAVVHNGIIENYVELREELERRGHRFSSDTDTEIVAHLIEEKLSSGKDFISSFLESISRLDGAFALVSIYTDEPDKILCARKRSPLVIGEWNNTGYIVSSDIPSLLIFTKKVIPLDDGEIAIVRKDGLDIMKGETQVSKESITISWDVQMAERGGYKHFMLKEINEQPHVVGDTASEFLSIWDKLDIPEHKKILITACGTSYHAGLLGKLWIESFAHKFVEVEYASELRYKDKDFSDSLVIAISQSGETADTLEAVRRAKDGGAKIIALVNVLGSTMTREADILLHTNAGPEVGVAATKTFLSQITVMFLLSLRLAGISKSSEFIRLIRYLPPMIDEALKRAEFIREMAEELSEFRSALYLGRWISFPVAMEGALKLKEISYIHAEAYPAGEMKHGPIALISPDVLSVFIVPRDRVFKKTISNIQEVSARQGKSVVLTTKGAESEIPNPWKLIVLPETNEFLSPFVTTPVLQLIAYYTATYLGHDVDQPRNLAKSVTVE